MKVRSQNPQFPTFWRSLDSNQKVELERLETKATRHGLIAGSLLAGAFGLAIGIGIGRATARS